jgi:ATP-dependent Clp protease ATP-binding subunit ClpC
MIKKANEKIYTVELNEVIRYMESVLINEFPIDTLTPEYLVLSILDIKNCHANLILDNCLMSNNIEELRKIYISVIEKYSNPQLKKDKIEYNEELDDIFNAAKYEAEKTKSSLIGSEHILLAILNKDNDFSEEEVFRKFRLEYKFIFDKCYGSYENANSQENKRKTPKLKTKKTSIAKKVKIPLKSEINTKTSSYSSSNEFIEKYTTSINDLVKEGKVENLIGRNRETQEIIKIFSRRNKNNVILVGKGGTGKTSIVYNLAKLIEEDKVPSILENKKIVMLNSIALISGTNFRGMFEERINGLFGELKSSNKYILFIDDIHTVLKSGTKEKDGDISNVIGELLSENSVRVIGTTTFKDYRNTIEGNSQLSRKFQKIVIEPMTKEESFKVVNENKIYYENFHNVSYSEEAIKKTIELAERYITDRSLPDSAFDIIDLAGARTSIIEREPIEIQHIKKRLKEIEIEKDESLNQGEFEKIDSLTIEENVLVSDLANYKRNKKKTKQNKIEITENDIADTVSEMTNIPVNKLTSNEKERIAHIDETLKKVVIGQDEAIDEICRVIKRNRVGLSDGKACAGCYLFLGRSATGKTLLAKTIAKEIYGDENALIRLDMSEYSEKNSVSKLHGTAQGYIGYDDGGVLTNAIKQKPYSVVLLDEIEKADESIYNLFLQVFDEGRLTESNGNVIDCHNCMFIMTSNIGTRKASELGDGVGFTSSNNTNSNKKSIINKELKRRFSPEFLNRINKIVYFNDLTEDNLKDIIKLEINKLNNKLNNINYNIIYSNDVVDYIHVKAIQEKDYGARPIIRLIQNNLEDKITDLMLTNEYEPNYTFSASCKNDNIIIQ